MREGILRAALLGGGALLLALAWLTGHPDAAIVERATRCPGLGPLAIRFREIYRPPPPAAPPIATAEAGGVEVITIWLPPPPAESPSAPPLAPVSPPPAPAQPIDRSIEPVLPLAARPATAERLAAVAAVLGPQARQSTIGPYAYLGDVDPPERWDLLAGALDAAFAERTGRVPLGEPAETVVAVADPARYRELTRLEPRLAGLAPRAHAAGGLAVVLVEPGAAQAAEAALVHELTHLVVRRALGPALPSWLDEGLAEDLAWTPFDAASGFRLGELAGTARRQGAQIEIAGAWAALRQVLAEHSAGRLPTLVGLVDLDWESFVGGEDAAARYAHAMLFVRFLLDGGDPLRAAGFRVFLERVAAGEPVERAALERAIGADLAALEPLFRSWLALREAAVVDPAVRALARPGERVDASSPARAGPG